MIEKTQIEYSLILKIEGAKVRPNGEMSAGLKSDASMNSISLPSIVFGINSLSNQLIANPYHFFA